jgi:uncharacterized protein (DUF58 family)
LTTAFYNQLYFTTRFYIACLGAAGLFVFAWLFHWPLIIPQVFLITIGFAILADFAYLFLIGYRFTCSRHSTLRFSNSDYNTVSLQLWHSYPYPLQLTLIEELPEQFQARTNQHHIVAASRTRTAVNYSIRPVHRGDYQFGYTICLLRSQLGFLQRRLKGSSPAVVKVYPSFLQLRQHQLLAPTATTHDKGANKLRKIGQSMEFETIKDYITGDDVRAVNWKATARKANLMVNHYMEERSQQVYCIIDKGRLMKMPFNGLALMDYAINSTLVLASVALHRQDRFGMLSFSHKEGDHVMADKKPGQLKALQESLYRMSTGFYETDFEKLYLQVRKSIKQRSLLIIFTNFESVTGMRRQLPYLRQLSKHHLLLVVFFQNTELAELSDMPAPTLEDVYTHTVAGKFVFEKKAIVKELMHHGILAILTKPGDLTIATVNKYLELKAKQAW